MRDNHPYTSMEAYVLYWKNAFNYHSRATRKEFIVPMTVHFVMVMLVVWLTEKNGISTTIFPGNLILEAMTYILIIPDLALICRRIRDINISGKYGIASYLIMLISGYVIAEPTSHFFPEVVQAMGAVTGGCALIVFAFLAMKDGTDGPNRFGADPRPIDALKCGLFMNMDGQQNENNDM